MLALGLLAIVQIALLPGLVGVLLLRLADGLLRTLVLSFALSILANYALVLLLALARVYTPGAMFIAFAVELVAAVWLIRHRGVGTPLRADLRRGVALLNGVMARPPALRLLSVLILAGAAVGMGICVEGALGAAGRVFSQWDAVVSWNKWAVQWCTDGRSYDSWSYPQLLPAIYSVTYQFIGTTDVQFFASALAGLFPLALLLSMCDLALRLGQVRYLAALALTAWAMPALLGIFSMSGFADEPVAALCFITLYWVIVADREESPIARSMIAGALCAAAAAATKQPGCFAAAAYPALAWLVLRRRTAVPARRRLLLAVALTLPAALATVPWYAFYWFYGGDWAVGYTAVGIHAGRGLLERAQVAVRWASDTTGLEPGLLCAGGAACLLLSLADGLWRWISVLLTVPLLLLWLFVVGYDARNAAPCVPLLVAGGMAGFGSLVARRLELAPARPRPVVGYALLALAAAGLIAVLALSRFRASRLSEAAYNQRTAAFDAGINLFLYNYSSNQGFPGKILTNYQILNFLPGLARYYKFHDLESERGLEGEIDDPAQSHVLYFGYRGVPETLKRLEAAGRLSRTAAGRRYVLFTIVRPPPAQNAGTDP